MNADLFGSYSILSTFAGISKWFLLKSIILYKRLWPPPRLLAVTLPLLFRPPDFDRPTVNVFSGLPDQRLSRDTNTSPRCPGIGFI